MKRTQIQHLVMLLVGVSLAAGSGLARGADLLVNGNLDLTYQQEIVPGFFLPKPSGWINDGFKTFSGPYEDEMSSEPWAGPAPTPVTANDWAVFFKPFSGNPSDRANGRLFQDVPGIAGATYELTGWAGAEANYSGLIPGTVTKSLFRLSFFDTSSTLLGGAVLDLVAAGLGTPNGQAFSYRQFSLLATAPAGTAIVRAEVAMLDAYANPAGGGQAFVVDDFTLQVPEPTTAAVAGLGLACLVCLRRRN